jgi:TRAP-type C4-dicarboxylate transport system substrate-binding protein
MIVLRTGTRRLALALAVVATGTLSAQAAEVTLRAQTALQRNHDFTKIFMKHYIEPVNKAGKGSIRISYLGGPEINPSNRAAAALQRGNIDVLHSPAAYYVGTVPYGQGLMASSVSTVDVRKNGAMEILEKVWNAKLNAHILAWGERAAQFHIYMTVKPPLGKDGMPDLKGMKIRSTPAYRALLTSLGATIVATPPTEVYTALQRGLVQGFGWPNNGLKAIGVHELVKFRIDPPFYHLANLVLINLDKWKSLTQAQRDLLDKYGPLYEAGSDTEIAGFAKADEEAFFKAGGQAFKLNASAARKYLAIANSAMWNNMKKGLSPEELAAIRPKLLQD